jgi:hypothetical protein
LIIIHHDDEEAQAKDSPVVSQINNSIVDTHGHHWRGRIIGGDVVPRKKVPTGVEIGVDIIKIC